jgi:hypothetical protein
MAEEVEGCCWGWTVKALDTAMGWEWEEVN